MKCYLLFDSGCTRCSELAKQIEAETEGRLAIHSLRSRPIIDFLAANFPNWSWQPTLLERHGDDARIYTGLWMRLRLLRLLGPRRWLKVIYIVRRSGVSLVGTDVYRRRLLKAGTIVASSTVLLGGKNLLRLFVGKTAQAEGNLTIISASPGTGLVGNLQTTEGTISFVSRITNNVWSLVVTGPSGESYASLHEPADATDGHLYGTISNEPITWADTNQPDADWGAIHSGTVGAALSTLRTKAAQLYSSGTYPSVGVEIGGLEVPAMVLEGVVNTPYVEEPESFAGDTYATMSPDSDCPGNECDGACGKGCALCLCDIGDKWITCTCLCGNYCRCHDLCCRTYCPDPDDDWWGWLDCCVDCLDNFWTLVCAGLSPIDRHAWRCTFKCRTP